MKQFCTAFYQRYLYFIFIVQYNVEFCGAYHNSTTNSSRNKLLKLYWCSLYHYECLMYLKLSNPHINLGITFNIISILELKPLTHRKVNNIKIYCGEDPTWNRLLAGSILFSTSSNWYTECNAYKLQKMNLSEFLVLVTQYQECCLLYHGYAKLNGQSWKNLY